MKIKFGAWLPDEDEQNTTGMDLVKNCLPDGTTYKPLYDLNPYSDALDARCQGAFIGVNSSQIGTNFAGDATKLYKLASASWSDVSNTGGYTTGSDEFWFFTQWANRIYATNFADAIQTFELGSSSTFISISSVSGATSASYIPKARYIATVKDFLMIANVNDATDGNVPYRVQWSAINNPLSWSISATDQASFLDLVSGEEPITQLIGGEYGTVFKRSGIYRLTYVGSPLIFQADLVIRGLGLISPAAAIQIDERIALLSREGFFIYDGNRVIPIGQGGEEFSVNEYFFKDLREEYLSRIVGTKVVGSQTLAWIYPGEGSSAGRPNKILFFDYSPNAKVRWTIAEIATDYIFNYVTESYTMQDLDVFGNMSQIFEPMDSNRWKGGILFLSAFDHNNKIGNFDGNAKTAEFITKELEFDEVNRALITGIRPLINAATSVQAKLYYKSTSADNFQETDWANPFKSGIVCLRRNSKFFKVAIRVIGGFGSAYGIEIHPTRKGGYR